MKKKVLVIDDEPDLLKVTMLRLEMSGYEVFSGTDGQQALTLAHTIMPDLIILDIYLPQMHGDEVAKVMKKDEVLKHIPIILISATTNSLVERANESGVEGYLAKPFASGAFIGAVKNVLESSGVIGEKDQRKKRKILAVDDDSDLLKVLTYRLEGSGYAVITACDGEEALQKISAEHPDVVILDIGLPRLNGEEVCRCIRKDPDICTLPVIMLTGKDKDVDRIVSRVIGADIYLTKPFDSKDLIKAVEMVLK